MKSPLGEFFTSTLLHSEMPKLYIILAFLSAIGLKVDTFLVQFYLPWSQTGNHISCFPLKIWWEIMEVYLNTLKKGFFEAVIIAKSESHQRVLILQIIV